MNVNFLRIVIISQVFTIFILVILVNYKKNDVLGASVSINPLYKEDLVFTSDKDLKTFYEPKPNHVIKKKADWLNYEAEYTINSDALNERFEYTVDKPKNVFRIITLGDSFTFGQYVDTQNNYPEQLEDLLNSRVNCKTPTKFEVINLGVGGYDIESSVARFKKRGIKYNPDLIFWYMKQDDLLIREYIEPKTLEYKKQMQETGELKRNEERGIFYSDINKAVQEFEKEYDKNQIFEYQHNALKYLRSIYKGPLVIATSPNMESEPLKMLVYNFREEYPGVFHHADFPVLERGKPPYLMDIRIGKVTLCSHILASFI